MRIIPSDHQASVFTWIGHLPKEYFDIIIMHYPQRSNDIKLTVEQQIHCLAWDIYTHWLVFTFLMEHEVWWWADMGRSDLQKLRDTLPKSNENGYSIEVSIHNWWPWQMWSLAKGVTHQKGRSRPRCGILGIRLQVVLEHNRDSFLSPHGSPCYNSAIPYLLYRLFTRSESATRHTFVS